LPNAEIVEIHVEGTLPYRTTPGLTLSLAS